MTAAVRSEGPERDYDLRVGAISDLARLITPKQLEVLSLVASGYSYADVGKMKFFSPHTVQNHVNAAVARAGAKSKTHLCVLLVESGLIRRNQDGIYEPVQDLRVVG